jgi:hypothetical protein
VILLALLVGVGAFAGSALSQWWQGGAVPAPLAEVAGTRARLNARVRVEVLNGGGRANMARRATDQLREQGFDVVYYGNADDFDRDSSVVLARTEHVAWARAVADALGVRTVRVEPDENLYLDVTVVLGGEWRPRPSPPGDTTDAVPPWWDPRTWFPRRPMAPGPDEKLVDPGDSGGGP